jgi:hypothetical protein
MRLIIVSQVYNTDQTGLQLEMVTGRTLDFKGSKKVEGMIQKSSPATHSITMQPSYSLDGVLQTPMLVVFREPGGAPAKFDQELKQFDNLYCKATDSGKATSRIMNDWFEDVFRPQVEPGSLLLIDSWGGYNSMREQHANEVAFGVIPPGTTPLIQPLDVYFNHPLKVFFRRLSDVVRRREIDFVLSRRVNVAKLISLTVYQFQAPRFQECLKYGWYAAGYVDKHPDKFDTPAGYCLYAFDPASPCHVPRCKEMPLLRCAYCGHCLCHVHCLFELHKCSN